MASKDTSQVLQCSGTAPQPIASSKPFPFLSLPAELRVMIYKEYVASLTITMKPHVIRRSDLEETPVPGLDKFWPVITSSPQFICLNRWSISLDLLPTCKLIRNEVAPLFAPLLSELATKPIRFDVSTCEAALALALPPSPLIACIDRDTCYMAAIPPAAEKFINLCHRPPASYALGPCHAEIIIIDAYERCPHDNSQLLYATDMLRERVQDIGRICVLVYSAHVPRP